MGKRWWGNGGWGNVGGFYSGDFPRRGASHSRPTAHRMRSRPPNAPWSMAVSLRLVCPNAARPARRSPPPSPAPPSPPPGYTQRTHLHFGCGSRGNHLGDRVWAPLGSLSEGEDRVWAFGPSLSEGVGLRPITQRTVHVASPPAARQLPRGQRRWPRPPEPTARASLVGLLFVSSNKL